MELNNNKLITREYILLTIINLLMSMNFYMTLTISPAYVLERFADFETLAGVVAALFLLGLLTSRFFAGRLVTAIGFRPPEAASYFFLVNAIVVLASWPFISKLFDKKGPAIILYPTVCLVSAGFFLLCRAQQSETLLLAAALFGIGTGAIQTVNPALVVHLVPKHRLGVGNATLFMALDGSAGAGSIIAGLIVPYTGFRLFFLIARLWTIVNLLIVKYVTLKRVLAVVKIGVAE